MMPHSGCRPADGSGQWNHTLFPAKRVCHVEGHTFGFCSTPVAYSQVHRWEGLTRELHQRGAQRHRRRNEPKRLILRCLYRAAAVHRIVLSDTRRGVSSSPPSSCTRSAEQYRKAKVWPQGAGNCRHHFARAAREVRGQKAEGRGRRPKGHAEPEPGVTLRGGGGRVGSEAFLCRDKWGLRFKKRGPSTGSCEV
jgi:hypothetical protein